MQATGQEMSRKHPEKRHDHGWGSSGEGGLLHATQVGIWGVAEMANYHSTALVELKDARPKDYRSHHPGH